MDIIVTKVQLYGLLRLMEKTFFLCHTGCIDFEEEYANNEPMKGTLKYGKFGKPTPEIAALTGKDNYDVEMSFWAGQMTVHAVLSDNGTKMIMSQMFDNTSKDLDEFYWISRDDIDKLIEEGDHVEALACPYKVQPGNQGKFIWVSGPPGAGKSTSAQLLSRNTGFVYYEADCVMQHANPYIPPNVANPSMAQMFQKHLKGITKERLDRVIDGDDFYMALSQKQELDEVVGGRFYKYMSECICSERKRIGGDWIVAQAVPTRNMRDVIRKVLGKDLVFILLSLKRETTLERLTNRHGDGEIAKAMTDFCIKVESFYELKAPDEENTYNIEISNEMTPNDVAEKILEIVGEL